MQRYLIGRLVHGVVVLIVVSMVTFGLLQLAPGGPAILLQPGLDQEQIRLAREQLGLDDPAWVQYGKWVLNFVTGDLGRSFTHREPVAGLLATRFPASLVLCVAALLFALVLGLPLAMISATRRNTLADYASSLVSLIGISMPSFWFGILLIIFFSVNLRWLPSSGMMSIGAEYDLLDRLRYLAMPTLVLGLVIMPQVTRYARSSLITEMEQDYVRSARAKGLSERKVMSRHVLRNALMPVVTVIGYNFSRLIGGTIVVETVFSWPGLGFLAYRAASDRDYPVVMAITVLVSVFVVASNLVVDLLYGAIDPRVRYE